MIAPVVAGTSHTLVTRRPCADACGTRVQTMPLALATSIAATRATSCSYSSSWISCGSCIAGPSPPSPWARYQGCPGASVGNRKSEPRAPSTVRDPSRSRPRRQTDSTASATRNAPASAGNPARFSRLHGVPRRDMETDRKVDGGRGGDLEHALVHVRAGDDTAGPDPCRGSPGHDPGAAGHVEHAFSWLDRGQVEELGGARGEHDWHEVALVGGGPRSLELESLADGRSPSPEQLPRPREHAVQHRLGEAPGARVLLAHVVGAEEDPGVGEGGLGGVGEAGLGADGAEVAQGLVPGEGAEGDDHVEV